MRRIRQVLAVGSIVAMSGLAYGQDAADEAVVAEGAAVPTESALNANAKFLISEKRFTSDEVIGWEGFLTGTRGFEQFYEPVGMPYYFESPINTTEVRGVYLYNKIPSSALGGGEARVYAVQARIALTERLGLIATKDGWVDLETGAFGESSGWNSVAAGLKYVLVQDVEAEFILSTGVRYELANGSESVLQGGPAEWSPFVSFGKGAGRWHFMGHVTARVPESFDRGNAVLNWSLHADFDMAPEFLPGLAPLVEIHGNHYLTDGTAVAGSVGGLDFANIGASDVAGTSVVWMGVGARVKLTPNVSLGATYEFPLTSNKDILDERVTADLRFVW